MADVRLKDFTKTTALGGATSIYVDRGAGATGSERADLADVVAAGLPAASTSVAGIVQLAGIDGTDVTPAKAVQASDLRLQMFQRAWKPTDESVSLSTTLQTDDYLSFGLAAGTWKVELLAWILCGTVGGVKFHLGGSATRSYEQWLLEVFDESPTVYFCDFGTDFDLAGSGTYVARLAGIVEVTVAGSLTVQWAQSVSHNTQTRMLRGSYMVAMRLP
jgi:hypothetical protein